MISFSQARYSACAWEKNYCFHAVTAVLEYIKPSSKQWKNLDFPSSYQLWVIYESCPWYTQIFLSVKIMFLKIQTAVIAQYLQLYEILKQCCQCLAQMYDSNKYTHTDMIVFHTCSNGNVVTV